MTLKGFKKRLTPMNARGSSPSFSSASSTSSSYIPPFGQQQHQQNEFRSLERSNLSPTENEAKNPEIIIRALKPYNGHRPSELTVKVGDFLQVVGEVWAADGSGWFEAIAPFSGSRGYVPIHHFQVFSSGGYHPSRPSKQSTSSSVLNKPELELSASRNPKPLSTLQQQRPSLPTPQPAKKSPTNQSLITRQPLYGVVRYDFMPQRNDELQAEKGEAIVLIAHSHQDWFVAKPIGRLGGPGLIPVTYVEVKDLATGKGLRPEAVRKLMQDSILPGIEEWKQASAAYRGNSIPLGRFENPTATSMASQQKIYPNLRREMTKSHQQLRSKPPEVDDTPVPRPVRSNVSPTLGPGHYQSKNNFEDKNYEQEETQPVDIPIPSSRPVEDIMLSSTEPLRSSDIPSQEEVQPTSNHWPNSSNNGHNIPEELKQEVTPVYEKVHSASGEDGYATVEDLRQRYGLLTHASVESFHKEHDQFWFHLRSHFSSPSSTDPTGEETTVLVLYRLYEDFFDFHAELLDSFPEEAGRENYASSSIFPKLPEPKSEVNEIVCAERVGSLSSYLEELSKLPSYIRDCEFFYEFLGPREGDVELLQESTPSVDSLESVQQLLTDEIEQLTHFDHDSIKSHLKNHVENALVASNKPHQVASSSLKRQSHLTHKSTNSSSNKYSIEFSEPPTRNSSQPQQQRVPGRKNHTSNFSSSSMASMVESVATPTNTTSFPEGNPNPNPTSCNSPPKGTFHRIKVYQENSADVIAIKVTNTLTLDELLEKITERVYSFHQESTVNKKIGTLFIKDDTINKDPNNWKQVLNDSQLTQWLAEFHGRLVLLYKPAD